MCGALAKKTMTEWSFNASHDSYLFTPPQSYDMNTYGYT